MLLFGLSLGVACFILHFCFFVLSEQQGIKIRLLDFRSLLRQDSGWYDFQNSGELTTKIISDVKTISDAMSPRVGALFQMIGTVLSAIVLCFVTCWDLALVLFSSIPFIVLSLYIIGFGVSKTTQKADKYITSADGQAESTIGNIRTVQYLNQENNFASSYNDKMNKAERFLYIRGSLTGLGIAVANFLIFNSFSLGLWYASMIIRGHGGSKNTSAGTVMTVFFSIITVMQMLPTIGTPLELLSKGKTAAFRIYNTIDRIPNIDTKDNSGKRPETCDGKIVFEDVQFSYPSRPEKTILNGLDLTIEKGKTVALVGESGCGKSTTIQLIQRLYEISGGSIKIDNTKIDELNVNWLRSQIGIVGQEPVLFNCSIKDNILLGAKEDQKVTDDDISEVCKMANASDFINKLPNTYDTLVGDRGALLSGGQKQRIAIARALIKNPQILLLDEATSALDTQSEKVVQNALEKAGKGRTTIIVAHRLSTVRNADLICVFHQGEIVEKGTHNELMDLKGTYYNLVKRQSLEEEADQDEVDQKMKNSN
ncbi:multidrug resistance protein, putative [Entamoeba invadens IP1]|uniref:Multidrug resistance protein, putative n=1 Tax=Entamoeba invadens IP1 TaxID=370355 RepID=L7FMC9_ENTIV|nr:multidrug resistance protein, putative [Entamoeba invadens IP1]ELP90963.1 multidrug resistance protein, putative [Entamoeba invadens IP1]|eukprot:XP_004257734.1 multidrug resistance protein, putative [Entamoeba invadens IP1]